MNELRYLKKKKKKKDLGVTPPGFATSLWGRGSDALMILGAIASGAVGPWLTQGKFLLGAGPDKVLFKDFYDGEEQGLVYPARGVTGTLPLCQAWGRGP